MLLRKMIQRNEKTYTQGNFSIGLDEEGSIEFSRFEGTIMMSLGIINEKYEFDILDNPYVAIVFGRVKTDWVISENTDTLFRKRTDEEAHQAYHWYEDFKKNMVCFQNISKI